MKRVVARTAIAFVGILVVGETTAHATPCDPFVVETGNQSFKEDSTFLDQITSKTVVSTRYVQGVEFEMTAPATSPTYRLSCLTSSGDPNLDQKMRTATYWGTQAIADLSAMIARYFGKQFAQKPVKITMSRMLRDDAIGETVPATAALLYGADNNMSDSLSIGVYDLPDKRVFPVILAHELVHMFHRQYLTSLGLDGHRSGTFAEAMADFFAMRIVGAKRNEMIVENNGQQFTYMSRDLGAFNRYPQDQRTFYAVMQPNGEYLFNLFTAAEYPKKRQALQAQMEFAAQRMNDLSDMRTWYWYIGGMIINQSLFRVIDKNPAAAPAIEKAYLTLIPTVVNEDDRQLAALSRDAANEVLRKSFRNAAFFADRFVEQIEEVSVRDQVKSEFAAAISQF